LLTPGGPLPDRVFLEKYLAGSLNFFKEIQKLADELREKRELGTRTIRLRQM
jgi:hypothetical protein